MKVLTLHEPWATLVAKGIKTIETRSWPTKFRGRIAIHSGKREMPIPSEVQGVMKSHNIECDDLQYGKIIATAELYGSCLEMDQDIIDRIRQLWGEDEMALGWYEAGRFAWYLKDIRMLEEPVAIRGYQRLWNIDDNLLPKECR